MVHFTCLPSKSHAEEQQRECVCSRECQDGNYRASDPCQTFQASAFGLQNVIDASYLKSVQTLLEDLFEAQVTTRSLQWWKRLQLQSRTIAPQPAYLPTHRIVRCCRGFRRATAKGEKCKKRTTPGIPTWSPTVVLTGPDSA